MVKFAWVITIFTSIIGALFAWVQYETADTVFQQCAGAAIGLAWAIIPYCIARAITELGRK